MTTPQELPLERAIRLAGSQEKLGEKIGRSQKIVSHWLVRCRGQVPPVMAVLIEKALNGQVTRHELRPDIFD